MDVRPMRLEDYGAVVDVWRAAGLDYRPGGRDSRESVGRQLAAHGPLMLVAESGGLIVGAVAGSHDHRKGWVNRLAVLPEWRRKGVARRLVSRLEEGLLTLGISVLSATVYEDNAASLELLRSAGFKCIPEVRYLAKRARPDA